MGEGKKRSRSDLNDFFSHNATDCPGSRPPEGRHQPHPVIIAQTFEIVKGSDEKKGAEAPLDQNGIIIPMTASVISKFPMISLAISS